MNPATLGVLIPIIALLIPIVAVWTRHQQRMAELGARQDAGTNHAMIQAQAEQIRALEERVRVLERIVTDSGFHLSQQIESLREHP